MSIRDPLAEKFSATLAPWKKSGKKFDFDEGFVKWIQKYLEKLKLPCTLIDAKAWINKADFRSDSGERNDRCTLQWEGYQESLVAAESKPKLRALDGGRVVPDSDLDGANQSSADRAVDAPIEPEIPDEFKRLEGESLAAYNKRVGEIARQKMAKMTENMSFRSK